MVDASLGTMGVTLTLAWAGRAKVMLLFSEIQLTHSSLVYDATLAHPDSPRITEAC